MMPPVKYGLTTRDDANEASWEAARGGAVGAAKWGAAAVVLGGIGLVVSPVYKATTIQFKLYLQMSGMVLGGMIEADWRLRQYENQMRMQSRIMREKARWESYEQELRGESSDK